MCCFYQQDKDWGGVGSALNDRSPQVETWGDRLVVAEAHHLALKHQKNVTRHCFVVCFKTSLKIPIKALPPLLLRWSQGQITSSTWTKVPETENNWTKAPEMTKRWSQWPTQLNWGWRENNEERKWGLHQKHLSRSYSVHALGARCSHREQARTWEHIALNKEKIL